jgi:DNA transformation protein
MTKDAPIEALRKLGPKSGRWLREAGITTIAELKRLGPVVAFRLVKQRQPKASLNLLWAMAAGLKGEDWRELTEAMKKRLCKEAVDFPTNSAETCFCLWPVESRFLAELSAAGEQSNCLEEAAAYSPRLQPGEGRHTQSRAVKRRKRLSPFNGLKHRCSPKPRLMPRAIR